jgi:hypothetical protein
MIKRGGYYMKSHYELDEKTRQRIIELVKTCNKLGLGNVSFKYYRRMMEFFMSDKGNHWQLVVVRPFGKRDIYKIVNGLITYEFTGEEDTGEEDSENED